MTPREAAGLHKTAYKDWIRQATTEEIEESLHLMSPNSNATHWKYGTLEIEKRRHRESRIPHWTTTPLFWITLVTMIFAGIAAFPVLQSWFLTVPAEEKPSTSPPSPLHSPKEKPPASQGSTEEPTTDKQIAHPKLDTEQGEDDKPDHAPSR